MVGSRTRRGCALFRKWLVSLGAGIALAAAGVAAAGSDEVLPDTVARIKPSIVGVGTFQSSRRPPVSLRGTGFVVGDGHYVLTNLHVMPTKLNNAKQEVLAVFAGEGESPSVRLAAKVAEDAEHDMVLLKFSDEALPAMALGDSDQVREGQLYAFTGFPIGAILGLHPTTHRGIVSAITPDIMPSNSSGELSVESLSRLKYSYRVFQLDATVYPGNSGSPLYDPVTGTVIGVINKVFVQGNKKNALEKPSGISFAVPIRYAKALLVKAGL